VRCFSNLKWDVRQWGRHNRAWRAYVASKTINTRGALGRVFPDFSQCVLRLTERLTYAVGLADMHDAWRTKMMKAGR
jgi:hypothetical protein